MLNVLPLILCVFVFNLVSINTQGLRNVSRRQTVFNLIKKQKYDVIFLQETHWTDDLKDTILREWGGTILFNNFEHNARGTAILFFTTFDFHICDHTSDSHGRSIRTLIELTYRKFNLVSIYAPRTDTERQIYFHNFSAFFIFYRRKYLGRRFQLYL